MSRQRLPLRKPLASPVIEYRWDGIGMLVLGLAFGAVSVILGPALGAVALLGFFAPPFGAAMYLTVLRRGAREVVARADGPPPTTERETARATLRRVIRMLALQAAGMAAIVALFQLIATAGGALASGAYASGAFLGMGGALIATSRWLRRWEEERSALLLREPRYRWRGDGQRGSSWGRGMFDARDFYVVQRPG